MKCADVFIFFNFNQGKEEVSFQNQSSDGTEISVDDISENSDASAVQSYAASGDSAKQYYYDDLYCGNQVTSSYKITAKDANNSANTNTLGTFTITSHISCSSDSLVIDKSSVTQEEVPKGCKVSVDKDNAATAIISGTCAP